MQGERALTGTLIAIHEDRIQQAEDRIREALSTLTRHHSNQDRSTIARSLSAMIRPSTQILVWD